MTLPNILTLFRLLAAPGVVLAFLLLPRPFADWTALGLFVGASLTDYLDGYLARRLNQISRIGTMLDPIADKAMVMIALLALSVWSPLAHLAVIPAAIIMFREVFVSGLREFLGDTAGTLKVTNLAKWKTTAQMVAISMLFATGAFEHYFGMQSLGMTQDMVRAAIEGTGPDELGLWWKYQGMMISWWGGIVMLWIAAVLTLVTGWDYFNKSRPYLADGET